MRLYIKRHITLDIIGFITDLWLMTERLYVIEKGMMFSEYIIFKVCFGGRADGFYFAGITELIYGTTESK